MFLTNLLILKLQSYKNNSKPQIKTLQSYFHPYRGCPKSLKIAFVSLHFGKVLIARRATTFGKVLIARRATTFAKVDYFDYPSLLEYVV